MPADGKHVGVDVFGTGLSIEDGMKSTDFPVIQAERSIDEVARLLYRRGEAIIREVVDPLSRIAIFEEKNAPIRVGDTSTVRGERPFRQ